jgi:hypothetical protein
MSDLGSIMSGLHVERKAAKGESKHYIPFSKKEWAEIAAAFGMAPEDLEPKQLKALILALKAGKIGLTTKTTEAPAA